MGTRVHVTNYFQQQYRYVIEDVNLCRPDSADVLS